MPKHITVTAPEGRKTPISPNDGTDGGNMLYVEHGRVTRVAYSQDVRRSIARGDLVPCTLEGAKVETLDEADAPESLESGAHVTDVDLDNAKRRAAERMLAERGPHATTDLSRRAHPNADASRAPTFDTSDDEGKR